MHKLLVTAAAAAVGLSAVALAQTKPGPSTSGDAAAEAKFKAADKNSSGQLESTEAEAYKGKMAQVDTNKDGKISRDEFVTGTKAGHIK